jgi:hypothetical protein
MSEGLFGVKSQEVPPPKDMSLILLSIERLLLIHISIREDIEIEKLIERHTLNTNTKESQFINTLIFIPQVQHEETN